MKNNTVLTGTGVEVYTNNISLYADEFIERELEEERRQEIYTNNSIFSAMMFYISDRIDKPDNN